MRPILFTISPLPQSWLLPLIGLTTFAALLIGGFGWMRARRNSDTTSPLPWLVGALVATFVIAALLTLWSRAPIQLHSYGLLLVFGFFVATWFACLEARRRGYDPNLILDLALPLLFVSILFCRLVYVALNPGQFDSIGDVLSVWDGGLSFHGVFIGAPLVMWYFAWSRGMGFGQLADLITPSVFIGYAFGRLGCFMNGCCYGHACALPWAVRFPDEFNRNALTLPSHPTQIYSVIIALGLFYFMQRAKLMPRFNRFSGQLTLLFLALYAVERAFIEIFRNGATASPIFGISWLTEAQFASAMALIAIIIFWRVLSSRAERNAEREQLSKREIPAPKVSV